MSIKPIDLQTNIAHIHEVAKNEQGRSTAIVDGQHLLEKHSSEDSKRISERLDENKKAEKTAIKKEEDHRRKRKKILKSAEKKDQEKESADGDAIQDDRMGKMIDVKR
ncbi:MAG: hypothetical protein MUC95_00140 [Spirochaetes bacterium]|jgi:hypothetical protein|nr:hypothetical protein [Spirochaetota bacterium]